MEEARLACLTVHNGHDIYGGDTSGMSYSTYWTGDFLKQIGTQFKQNHLIFIFSRRCNFYRLPEIFIDFVR